MTRRYNETKTVLVSYVRCYCDDSDDRCIAHRLALWTVSCIAKHTSRLNNTKCHTHMNVYLTMCCCPPSGLLVAILVAQGVLLVVGSVCLAVVVVILFVTVAVVVVPLFLFFVPLLSSFPLAAAVVVVRTSSWPLLSLLSSLLSFSCSGLVSFPKRYWVLY